MCSWTFRLVKFDCIANTNMHCIHDWIISICALSMQKERNTFCMHTCLHFHHMKEIATDNERHEQNKRAKTHVTIIIVVFKVFSRVIYSKSVWPLKQSAHMETSLKGFVCNKSIWMWVLVAEIWFNYIWFPLYEHLVTSRYLTFSIWWHFIREIECSWCKCFVHHFGNCELLIIILCIIKLQ